MKTKQQRRKISINLQANGGWDGVRNSKSIIMSPFIIIHTLWGRKKLKMKNILKANQDEKEEVKKSLRDGKRKVLLYFFLSSLSIYPISGCCSLGLLPWDELKNNLKSVWRKKIEFNKNLARSQSRAENPRNNNLRFIVAVASAIKHMVKPNFISH